MIEFKGNKGILLGFAEGSRRVELIGQAVDTLSNISNFDLQDKISRKERHV